MSSKRSTKPAVERRKRLLRNLKDGVTDIHSLSDELGVSPSTVRRDLQLLTDEGHTTRTYGGALPGPSPIERSLNEKSHSSPDEKAAIAELAADLIPANSTAIFDAGTTVGRLAVAVRDRQDIEVITNGIDTIVALAGAEGVRLTVLGGELRPASQAILGAQTEEAMRMLGTRFAFIAGEAVTADRGVCSPTMAQARLKTMMSHHSTEVFVLADHTKLGKSPYAYWASPDRVWTLITDAGADTEQLQPFRESPNWEVLVAEMPD